MVKENLRAVLGSMVKRYGFETVSRILHEMEVGSFMRWKRESPDRMRVEKQKRRDEFGENVRSRPNADGRPWTM